MRPSSDTTYSVSLPQIESFRFLFSGGVNSKTGLSKGFPGGSVVKILPAVRETRETQVWSLGWEDCLEEGLVTDSIIRAWRIPWTRGAWQAVVHGVAKSWAWLKRLEHDLSKGQIWMSQKSFKCDCFLYQTQQCISLVVSVFIFLLHTSASLILLASARSQS